MTAVFEVASIFKLIDQASPALRQMLGSVENLDRAIIATQKSLSALGKTGGMSAMAGQIGRVTTEVGNLDRAFVQMKATTATITVAPLVDSTDIAIERAAALTAEWRGVATQAKAAATAASAMAGGSSAVATAGIPVRSGRHGPRQTSGMHVSNYSTHVPGGGHVRVGGTGGGAMLAVGGGLFTVDQMVKDALEPLHQEAKLKTLHIPDMDIARMKARARQIAVDVPGSGYAHNLENMGSAWSIVGTDPSMMIAQKFAEVDRVNDAMAAKHGGTSHKSSAYTLTRAIELMGKLTDEKTGLPDMKAFNSILDGMTRMSIASHGHVTPEEWLNFAQQAGPSSGNLTEQGMYDAFTVIQAMKGNRAGTAFTATSRQFQGGIMTAEKAHELERIGIGEEGDFTYGKRGKVKVNQGAMKAFVDKLQKDPLAAVRDELLPKLKAHGFDTTAKLVPELYKILGTAPEVRLIYELSRNVEQAEAEIGRAKGAAGATEAVAIFNKEDPTAAMSSFTTAFKDLLGAMGSPLLQTAIPGMNALTSVFNKTAEAAGSHPATTGVISSAIAGAVTGATTGFTLGWIGGMAGGPLGMIGGAAAGAGGGAILGGIGGAYYGMAATPSSPPGTPQSQMPPQGVGTSVWKWLFPDSSATDAAAVKTSFNDVAKAAGSLPGPLQAAATALRGVLTAAPPSGKQEIHLTTVLQADGQKLAQVVTKHQVSSLSGPSQGSPYFDSTRGTGPLDFALS